MPEHDTYIEAFAGGCVHPNTQIDMYNGTIKNAFEVKVGDMVLTHKGNYKEVIKVFTRDYDDEVYVISGLHTFRKLIITPEHPILTMKRTSDCSVHQFRVNEYHRSCPYKHPRCKKFKVLKYTEPNNISKGDYLVYPIHKMYDNIIKNENKNYDKNQGNLLKMLGVDNESLHIQYNEILTSDKDIDTHPYLINDDFLELCGFFIAEGSFDSERRVAFSFNVNEKEYINLVKNVMQKYFNCSYKEKQIKESNSYQIVFFSRDAYIFFNTFFGRGARNKYIHRSVMELPIIKLTNLLRTYIYGDGSFDNSKINDNKEAPYISIKSVSYNLMNQIKILLNRLGIISNILYKTKEKIDEENSKYIGEDYVIFNKVSSNYGIYILTVNGGLQCNKLNKLLNLGFEFTNVEGSSHGEINSEYIYIPVHDIEKIRYTGKVYNFEIEEDNSYIANGFCVHNCWTFFRKKPSKVEIINDVNEELINFYRVIQRQPKEFLERGQYELYSRSLYYEYLTDFFIKSMQDDGKNSQDISIALKVNVEYVERIMKTEFSNLEKAFRFFCMIKEAFGSKFGGGWGMGSVRNNATAFFNEFAIIDDVTKRLRNVQIDCRDFEEVIDSYDNDKILMLCDPPYIKSDNSDYYFKMSKHTFTMNDHQRLFLRMKSLKGKCILTIDNTEWIRERYTRENGFYVLENEVFYCSADKDNRRHETELIITNYDTKQIKKHVDSGQGKLNF